jgi:hypothetical protein
MASRLAVGRGRLGKAAELLGLGGVERDVAEAREEPLDPLGGAMLRIDEPLQRSAAAAR